MKHVHKFLNKHSIPFVHLLREIYRHNALPPEKTREAEIFPKGLSQAPFNLNPYTLVPRSLSSVFSVLLWEGR
jgi:hypothetical protein